MTIAPGALVDGLRRARDAAEAAARTDGDRGALLLDCVGAIEAVLEQVILSHDGVLPADGPRYHDDVINRAARPLDGVRLAIIARPTADILHRLGECRTSFRDEAGTLRYPHAAALVPLAPRAVRAVAHDIAGFLAS